MLTGNDKKSLFIMQSLNEGKKIKEISQLYQISMDQAKRLSRLKNLLERGKCHLDKESYGILNMLGLRALVLNPLFKDDDWSGIDEILSTIDIKEVTRDELKLRLIALNEKRKRISDYQKETASNIEKIEMANQELLIQQSSLLLLQEEINKTITAFNHYPKDVRNFLLDHIGLYEKEFVLIKRLDSLWLKKLKTLSIIEYDQSKYIHRIKNIDQLVNEWLNRTKRKANTEWDYQRECKRQKDSIYGVPLEPYYKLGKSLIADSLIQQQEKIQREIDEHQRKIKEYQNQLERLTKRPVSSFVENIEKSNSLSERELINHGRLQEKASKWLFKNGYVVVNELTLPNGKRVDTIGIDENKHIIIIETKASIKDLQRDEKWQEYLPYSDEFYFCLETDLRDPYKKDALDAGCLVEYKNGLRVAAESNLTHNCIDREKIQYLIGRALSKKAIFGY